MSPLARYQSNNAKINLKIDKIVSVVVIITNMRCVFVKKIDFSHLMHPICIAHIILFPFLFQIN